mmetsp:Transcript_18154/g.27468  ORF Transcript_18154/g.27468 Transcript_18154/m.27468 type:complete len:161 (+) Transcript_18154:81-563(+)
MPSLQLWLCRLPIKATRAVTPFKMSPKNNVNGEHKSKVMMRNELKNPEPVLVSWFVYKYGKKGVAMLSIILFAVGLSNAPLEEDTKMNLLDLSSVLSSAVVFIWEKRHFVKLNFFLLASYVCKLRISITTLLQTPKHAFIQTKPLARRMLLHPKSKSNEV